VALAELCRERGVLSLVDAAHSAGSMADGSPELPVLAAADFVTGNLHKWACAPRGAGFLYAREAVQHMIEPPVCRLNCLYHFLRGSLRILIYFRWYPGLL
jgi:isopenicillin-N epimerase